MPSAGPTICSSDVSRPGVGEKRRTDFNDDGGDRMQWGEQIRKLDANKSRSVNTYKALLRQKAFEMFEDSEHFGPALGGMHTAPVAFRP